MIQRWQESLAASTPSAEHERWMKKADPVEVVEFNQPLSRMAPTAVIQDDYRTLLHELQDTNRLTLEAYEALIRERDSLLQQVEMLRAVLKQVNIAAGGVLARVATVA